MIIFEYLALLLLPITAFGAVLTLGRIRAWRAYLSGRPYNPLTDTTLRLLMSLLALASLFAIHV